MQTIDCVKTNASVMRLILCVSTELLVGERQLLLLYYTIIIVNPCQIISVSAWTITWAVNIFKICSVNSNIL